MLSNFPHVVDKNTETETSEIIFLGFRDSFLVIELAQLSLLLITDMRMAIELSYVSISE